jgi:glycosyltransferase involved in cell wall biosynthesis
MKPLRILMLLENNPFPQDTRVRHEAFALSSAGYNVSVICQRGNSQPYFDCINGVCVYRFPAPAPANGLIGYAWEYSYSTIAFLLISLWVFFRHGFDVVHAHNPPDTLVFIALLYKCMGKRFVFDHHDLSPEMYYARFGGQGSKTLYRVLCLMEKLSCRVADHVIATNQSYKRLEIQRDGLSEDQITIVRNGPDLDQEDSSIPVVDLEMPGQILIGYAGVIGYHDGVDYLLRALHHLRNDFNRPDFCCIVMGDGDALVDVKGLCNQLGLDQQVQFTGWIPHAQLTGYINAVNICAAPEPLNDYNNRSTMIKITEYMAAAKPVVAFDLCEHRVTAGDAALYAQANDTFDFAYQLNILMNNANLRAVMGHCGRERIDKNLAWVHQTENLLSVYSRLSGKHND